MVTWAHCIDSFGGKSLLTQGHKLRIINQTFFFLFLLLWMNPSSCKKTFLFFLRIYQNCYVDLSIVCVLLFSISRWWVSVGRRTTPAAGMFWFSRPPSVWTVWSRSLHARDATTSSIRYCPPEAHSAEILATVSQCAPVITLSNGLSIYLSGRSVYYRIEEALINPLVTCLLCTVTERCLMISLSDSYFLIAAHLHLLSLMS